MHESAIELPIELVAWVEQVCGSEIVAASPHHAGASRSAWLVELGGHGSCFLLRDRNDRGGSERDADVLRSLSGGVVPVPTVVAHDTELRALLLERLPGTSVYPVGEDPAEDERVAADLMRIAAALHSVDAKTLRIPHLGGEREGEDGVTPALDAIEGVRAGLGDRFDPLLSLTSRWLDSNRPPPPQRICLVHSDLGPGNFLHEGGRVTGLVDWEVAHLGDPMEDLAALAVRDMATPVGRLADRYREYAKAGGGPVLLDRVRYFQLLVLSRNSALIRSGIEGGGEATDAGEMKMFETLLLRGAALVLCDAVGVPRPPASTCVPAVGGETASLRLECEELAALLGRSVREHEIAAALGEVADGGVPFEAAALYFARRAHRQAELRRSLLGPLFPRLPQVLPEDMEGPS